MPKYEVSYGEVIWYHGYVTADSADDVIDLIESGDVLIKAVGSELYDGINVKETKV